MAVSKMLVRKAVEGHMGAAEAVAEAVPLAVADGLALPLAVADADELARAVPVALLLADPVGRALLVALAVADTLAAAVREAVAEALAVMVGVGDANWYCIPAGMPGASCPLPNHTSSRAKSLPAAAVCAFSSRIRTKPVEGGNQSVNMYLQPLHPSAIATVFPRFVHVLLELYPTWNVRMALAPVVQKMLASHAWKRYSTPATTGADIAACHTTSVANEPPLDTKYLAALLHCPYV